MTAENKDRDYRELLARIESGEVSPIPGSEHHGEASALQGQQLLLEATGTTTIDEAINVALGRPRKEAVPTTTVKAVMPKPMAARVHRLAQRQQVSAAQILRTATAEYLEKMAA